MMTAPLPPEFTIICIDNGARTLYQEGLYNAQLKGARYYCETVLKLNSGSRVSIFTMSTKSNVILVPPTNDLQKLLRALEYIPCHLDGETDVQDALAHACSTFSRGPPKMKKRLLMFVGSTTNLHLRVAYSYGEELRKNSVALDVYNFCLVRSSPLLPTYEKASIFQGTYHYSRNQLKTLVSIVNHNGNSSMKDIVGEYESSVIRTLTKRLQYLEKKAAADVKKNKSYAEENTRPAANERTKSPADDEYGQAHPPPIRNKKPRKRQTGA